MSVYQSVLVLSVLWVVMCKAGVSLWPTPSPSWTPVAGRVLREALTGPLSGHQVILMVDNSVQRSLSLDLLLIGLNSPTTLLHNTDKLSMPQGLSKGNSKAITWWFPLFTSFLPNHLLQYLRNCYEYISAMTIIDEFIKKNIYW